MRINKCDICKKEIKYIESIDVRFEYNNYELCYDCNKPVLNFLKKNKLVKKNEEK